MSGASEAANELRTAALARYDELRALVSHTSAAVLALRGSDDLIERLKEANRLSLALEALSELAHDMRVNTDLAMTRCMEAVGCPSFRTESHTVSTRRNPATVDIPDENAVPERFLSTPKPKPDRAKIRAAVQADKTINWATLREGGIGLSRRSLT